MLSFKWCRLLPSGVRLSSCLRRSKALGSGCNDKSSAFHVVTSHKSSGCGCVRAVRDALVSAPASNGGQRKGRESTVDGAGRGRSCAGRSVLERKGASFAKVLLIKCQFHCGAVWMKHSRQSLCYMRDVFRQAGQATQENARAHIHTHTYTLVDIGPESAGEHQRWCVSAKCLLRRL